MADETRAIYEKVAADAGGNIAFACIGLAVFWLCTRFWPIAAKVLFWISAAGVALSIGHFLIVFSAGVALWAAKKPPARSKWMWAATAVRLLEQAFYVIALCFAARAVGYLR